MGHPVESIKLSTPRTLILRDQPIQAPSGPYLYIPEDTFRPRYTVPEDPAGMDKLAQHIVRKTTYLEPLWLLTGIASTSELIPSKLVKRNLMLVSVLTAALSFGSFFSDQFRQWLGEGFMARILDMPETTRNLQKSWTS